MLNVEGLLKNPLVMVNVLAVCKMPNMSQQVTVTSVIAMFGAWVVVYFPDNAHTHLAIPQKKTPGCIASWFSGVVVVAGVIVVADGVVVSGVVVVAGEVDVGSGDNISPQLRSKNLLLSLTQVCNNLCLSSCLSALS